MILPFVFIALAITILVYSCLVFNSKQKSKNIDEEIRQMKEDKKSIECNEKISDRRVAI